MIAVLAVATVITIRILTNERREAAVNREVIKTEMIAVIIAAAKRRNEMTNKRTS